MAIKVSVFIATSLDGFIARNDGSIDWLDQANQLVTAGEDCGYGELMSTVDVLVMGRKTFEKVLSFGIDWPYEKPVVVLSRKGATIPADLEGRVRQSSASPSEVLAELGAEGKQHVYLDGGAVIQSYMQQGLVDEITVTVIPVLIGEGLPLFGTLKKDQWLQHERTKAYDFGFVQTTYSIRKQ